MRRARRAGRRGRGTWGRWGGRGRCVWGDRVHGRRGGGHGGAPHPAARTSASTHRACSRPPSGPSPAPANTPHPPCASARAPCLPKPSARSHVASHRRTVHPRTSPARPTTLQHPSGGLLTKSSCTAGLEVRGVVGEEGGESESCWPEALSNTHAKNWNIPAVGSLPHPSSQRTLTIPITPPLPNLPITPHTLPMPLGTWRYLRVGWVSWEGEEAACGARVSNRPLGSRAHEPLSHTAQNPPPHTPSTSRAGPTLLQVRRAAQPGVNRKYPRNCWKILRTLPTLLTPYCLLSW